MLSALAEFAAGAGHERHGVMVDYDGFIKAGPPKRGVTSRVETWDLRLRADTATVDRGCRLPNINDTHTGAAPDLGCHERGDAPVHYGPRPPRGE